MAESFMGPAGLVSWLCALFFFALVMWILVRARAYCGIASLGYLGLLVLVRPVMFLLGMDGVRGAVFMAGQTDELIFWANLAFILWLLCYIVGYAFLQPAARVVSGAFPAPPPEMSSSTLLWLSALATAAGVAGTLLLVSQHGSLGAFMYAVKIQKSLAGLYAIREITILAAIICLIGILHRLKYGGRGVTLLVALIAFNMFASYAWGNRGNLAYFLLAALISYHFFVRRLSPLKLAIILPAAAFGFQALAFLRADLVSSSIGVDSFLKNAGFWESFGNALHFAEFDALMLAIQDAGTRFPFQGGSDFINGLVSWIPRQVWPDKPETYFIGRWFRQVYHPGVVNGWPVTVIGSWYVNFGTLGIVFGGLLSGLIAAAIDLRYRALVHVNAFAAVMPIMLGIFFLAGGYDTGTLQDYVLLVIPLFFVSKALRRQARAKGHELRQPAYFPGERARGAI